MLEKLEDLHKRFLEVSDLLVQPDTMANMTVFTALSKEYKELEKIVTVFKEYKNVLGNIESAKEVLENEKDGDFRDMAKMELDELVPKRDEMEEELKTLLIPKDPNDSKNVILEIRGGAGGDESAIFAGDLFRMYQRYAEKQGWRMTITDFTEGSAGGYSIIVAKVEGEDVYGSLKFESGET